MRGAIGKGDATAVHNYPNPATVMLNLFQHDQGKKERRRAPLPPPARAGIETR